MPLFGAKDPLHFFFAYPHVKREEDYLWLYEVQRYTYFLPQLEVDQMLLLRRWCVCLVLVVAGDEWCRLRVSANKWSSSHLTSQFFQKEQDATAAVTEFVDEASHKFIVHCLAKPLPRIASMRTWWLNSVKKNYNFEFSLELHDERLAIQRVQRLRRFVLICLSHGFRIIHVFSRRIVTLTLSLEKKVIQCPVIVFSDLV